MESIWNRYGIHPPFHGIHPPFHRIHPPFHGFHPPFHGIHLEFLQSTPHSIDSIWINLGRVKYCLPFSTCHWVSHSLYQGMWPTPFSPLLNLSSVLACTSCHLLANCWPQLGWQNLYQKSACQGGISSQALKPMLIFHNCYAIITPFSCFPICPTLEVRVELCCAVITSVWDICMHISCRGNT